MKVTLIRGLPGSGKSSAARELGCAHVESDFYFMRDGQYRWDEALEEKAHDWCYRKFAEHLAEGVDVVVSNVFPTLESLKRYIRFAIAFGAELSIRTLTDDFGSIHNVCEADMRRFKETFLSKAHLDQAIEDWLKEQGANVSMAGKEAVS